MEFVVTKAKPEYPKDGKLVARPCLRITVNSRFTWGIFDDDAKANPDWLEKRAIPAIAKHFASEFDYAMTDEDKDALRAAVK